MKNVAIFSNSFVSRTLMSKLDYLMGNTVNKIYLLKENHDESEIFPVGEDTSICICDSFEECIDNCDIIIVNRGINLVESNKIDKSIIVEDFWKNNNEGTVICPNMDCAEKPVIVILSVGKYTDLYYTELLINKILIDMKAKPMQIFSEETKSVLDTFSQAGLLNPSLSNMDKTDYDVTVLSVNVAYNDSKMVQMINEISPDIVLLCVNQSFTQSEELKCFSKMVCNIDGIIKSPYISYETDIHKTNPVYCGNRCSNDFINSLNQDFEQQLKKIIERKITLPTGVSIL